MEQHERHRVRHHEKRDVTQPFFAPKSTTGNDKPLTVMISEEGEPANRDNE